MTQETKVPDDQLVNTLEDAVERLYTKLRRQQAQVVATQTQIRVIKNTLSQKDQLNLLK